MTLSSTREKILAILLLLVFVGFMLFIGKTQRDRHNNLKKQVADQKYLIEIVNKRTKEIEQLINDKKKGRRKDPFRCSDAKQYFNRINIAVDCSRIKNEVNGGAE